MVLSNQINKNNKNNSLKPIQKNSSIYDFFEENDYTEINDLDILQDNSNSIIWNNQTNSNEENEDNEENEENEENESEEEKPCGTTGLTNMGNTCYLNSVIQALSNIEVFANLLNCKSKRNEQLVIENYFKKNNPTSLKDVEKYKEEYCFTTTMDKTIEILWNNQYEAIMPTSIRKAIVNNFQQFNNNYQHDAEECLRHILNKLDEELQYKSYDINISSDKYKKIYDEYQNCSTENKKSYLQNLNEIDRVNLKEMLSFINFNKSYSPIQEIFQFVISSTITCDCCNNCSKTEVPEIILSLEIPELEKKPTYDSTTYNFNSINNYGYNNVYNGLLTSEGEDEEIEETEPNKSSSENEDNENNDDDDEDDEITIHKCFKKFFSSEKLVDSNKWFCDKCNDYVESTKKMKLCRTGNILLIQFKRFKQIGNSFSKNTEEVKFPFQINLKKYFEKEEDYNFSLKAVINHEGHNLQYGHYTTYALNEIDSNWYYFNDENVVQETDLTLIDDDDAYILVYQKI